MTLTLTGLVILLITAGICGAIGRAIGGGTAGGFIVSVAVGFVGALVGTFLAIKFHLPEVAIVYVDGQAFPILWSIVGAAIVVGLVQLISGGRSGRFRYR